MGVRYLLIALMMVVVSSDNVCAMQSNETLNEESDNDNNDSKEGITGDNLSKELNFAIRATVPSSIYVEVVKGSDGIDLLDPEGNVVQSQDDRSFRFVIKGFHEKYKLSVSGSDGLIYKNRESSGHWYIQHKNDHNKTMKVFLSLYHRTSVLKTNLKADEEVLIERVSSTEPDLTILVGVISNFYLAGDYFGKLILKIAAVD